MRTKETLIVGLALLLSACAAAYEKPQGLKDQMAISAANWNAANETLVDLCGRGVWSPEACEAGEAASSKFETAAKLFEEYLKLGDLPAAQAQLAAAQAALRALQLYARTGEKTQ